MGLVSKSNARERILVLGGPGVGKTSAWLSIAERSPDAHFYVIDTDHAVDRMIESRNLSNVTHKTAAAWEDFVSITADYSAKMRADDWLVVDFFSPGWDAVQDWYVQQVHGKNLDTYFLEARKRQAKGNPIDGDKDWPIIKRVYAKWVEALKTCPGHVYVTTPAQAVGERDDAAVRAMFGVHGVRPAGNKQTGHWPHTVLLFTKTRVGEYVVSTVKDRERRELDKATVANFVNGYLIPIAGFRPGA